MSFDKYKAIYKFYNNWFEIPNLFKDLNPIIGLCRSSLENEEELKKAIDILLEAEFKAHNDLSEIQNELSFYYAHSVGLSLIRLQNNLACLEDEAFTSLRIRRKTVLQITVAIVFYYLLINVPNISAKLSKQQSCDYLSNGVTFDYILLKKICWEIDETAFQNYMKMFAFNIDDAVGDSVVHEQLFCVNNRYIVFDIREFVRYIILRLETIATECLSPPTIEKYRANKGKRFEEEVYDLFSLFFPQTKRNLYYYKGDARCEIDIVVEDEKGLLVGECKSNTVILTYDLDEKQILNTAYRKTKKSIRTLKRFDEYYKNNEYYTLVKGNKSVVFEGICEKPLILLNITMDAFETLSPNLDYYLPEKNESDTIILTISYEHLLAIILDCEKRGISIMDYLLKRQAVKQKNPRLALEINELDLYAAMTDKYGPSSLNEILEKNMFDDFPNLRKAIASFHDAEGNEISPANDMIDEVDNYILSSYIPHSKMNAGINKKYIRLLYRVLDKQDG